MIKPPKVTFTLIKNHEDSSYFTASIVLDHLEYLASGEYELAFNSMKPIVAIDNAQLLESKQGGDFYKIKIHIIQGNHRVAFTLKGRGSIRHYTDAPAGYFLIKHPEDQNTHPSSHIISVTANTLLPPWQPALGEDEESKNKKKEHTSIEGNPADTMLTPGISLIVPLPAELQRTTGHFLLNQWTKILYQDKAAQSSAAFFAKAIQPATGYKLDVKYYQSNQLLQNAILLTTQDVHFADDKQKHEGYTLEVTPSYIVIRALSAKGFFYGLQSLRQLLPAEIFSQQLQSAMEWKIPSVFIRDYPRFEYRGLHVDSARHFISVQAIKRLIDLMAIHKLNYFEWHLTDDEGWRIEIKQYPALTKRGAWRGYSSDGNNGEHVLPPAYGSGAKSYGGFYTQNDIRDIVQYAQDRYVTIIPEIDMPGHARALIMSLPEILVDRDDKSHYTSIQGYHDNVLSPCKKEVFTVIDHIFSEVAQLFPGKYIHIGGDEVPDGAWQQSCMAKKYHPDDPKFKTLVQNEFLQKIQDIIHRKGKIMAGWEEIADDNSTLAAPLRVYIWNTSKIEQAYKKSVHAGYEVIMAPAENLYFDLAYSADPKEPGQYWAGYVDTFSAYAFKPIDADKGQNDTVIKGVQGQLWSEMIDSPERLDYLAFPKVAGLAELAWTPAKRRNWKNFSDRMRELHLPRLDHYGVKYRRIEFAAP